MADANKSEGGKKTWLSWFLFLELIAVVFFVPPHWFAQVQDIERRWGIGEVGLDAATWIEVSGYTLYRDLFLSTGLLEALRKGLLLSPEEIANSRGLERMGYAINQYLIWRIDTWEIVLQRVFVRLFCIFFWAPLFLTIVCPALADGMWTWRKRQYSFAYPSPIVHGWSIKGVKFSLFLSLMFLIFPLPVPILAVPFVYLVVAGLLQQAAAHTKKRI